MKENIFVIFNSFTLVSYMFLAFIFKVKFQEKHILNFRIMHPPLISFIVFNKKFFWSCRDSDYPNFSLSEIIVGGIKGNIKIWHRTQSEPILYWTPLKT